jgi:hypothetical protein
LCVHGFTTDSNKGATTTSTDNTQLINIIIDKIDKYTIYSKDGQVFYMTSSTHFIDNSIHNTKVRIGELFFKDGTLVTVIIK